MITQKIEVMLPPMFFQAAAMPSVFAFPLFYLSCSFSSLATYRYMYSAHVQRRVGNPQISACRQSWIIVCCLAAKNGRLTLNRTGNVHNDKECFLIDSF